MIGQHGEVCYQSIYLNYREKLKIEDLKHFNFSTLQQIQQLQVENPTRFNIDVPDELKQAYTGKFEKNMKRW